MLSGILLLSNIPTRIIILIILVLMIVNSGLNNSDNCFSPFPIQQVKSLAYCSIEELRAHIKVQ